MGSSDSMTGLAILVAGGIILFTIVVNRLNSMWSRAISRASDAHAEVVNKKKNAEVDGVAAVPLEMSTPGSMADVASALDSIVGLQSSPPMLGAGLYVAGRSNDTITYAIGNKIYPRDVVAEVRLRHCDGETHVVFKCLHLSVRDGTRPLGDAFLRLRASVECAVRSTGDPTAVAAGVKAYGPAEPGSPAAAKETSSKVLFVIGMTILSIALFKLGTGVRIWEIPLWFAMAAIGSWIARTGFRRGRINNLPVAAPGLSAAADSAAAVVDERARVGASVDSGVPAAIGHTPVSPGEPAEAPTPRPYSRTQVLFAVGGLVAVLIAGIVLGRMYTNPGSSYDSSAGTSQDAGNPGGTGGDYTPTGDTASSSGSAGQAGASTADSPAQPPPPSHLLTLDDLQSTAPAGGSAVTRTVYWDGDNSIDGERIAFTTDDPERQDWIYMVGIDELTTCYVGDKSVPAADFIAQAAYGMFHTGTIVYTNSRLTEIRVVMKD